MLQDMSSDLLIKLLLLATKFGYIKIKRQSVDASCLPSRYVTYVIDHLLQETIK